MAGVSNHAARDDLPIEIGGLCRDGDTDGVCAAAVLPVLPVCPTGRFNRCADRGAFSGDARQLSGNVSCAKAMHRY